MLRSLVRADSAVLLTPGQARVQPGRTTLRFSSEQLYQSHGSGKRSTAEDHKTEGDLTQRVFPPLDYSLRDLLPEFDGIERLMLSQSAQDSHLGAEHISLRDSSDHFSGRGFTFLHRLRKVDARHGNGKRGGCFPFPLSDFLRPQH